MVLVQKQILKIDVTNRKAMNKRLLYMRRQQKSASQIKKERLLFGKLLNIQVKYIQILTELIPNILKT